MRIIDFEIILAILTILGMVVTVVFYIGGLSTRIDINKRDINSSREAIRAQVMKEVERKTEETENRLTNHENILRAVQIRQTSIEKWGVTYGYRPVDTKTDFEG